MTRCSYSFYTKECERRGLTVHTEGLMFFNDDKPIDVVKSLTHLDHLIISELSDDDDVTKRRIRFRWPAE